MGDQATAELLEHIRRVGQRRAKADRARQAAAGELAVLVRQAKGAGVPVAQIARTAQLSRERVYKILERDQS